MPKRWLKPREPFSPTRWAAGCHECGAETSFTGETSHLEAWGWYSDHFCPEEPPDDPPYLTLPRLDMTADELLSWARENGSITSTWVLEHIGEDEPAKRATEPS
jgi:hypothetical protein